MRLTIETKDKNVSLYNFGDEQLIANKLGQLENIEDELGIDLITLFKALNNNNDIYFLGTSYYEEPIVRFTTRPKLSTTAYKKLNLEDKSIDVFYFACSRHKQLYFKDYGKTWALTKEELK